MPKVAKLTHPLHIRLPQPLLDRLRRLAQADERGVSDFVRRVLERYVSETPTTKEK